MEGLVQRQLWLLRKLFPVQHTTSLLQEVQAGYGHTSRFFQEMVFLIPRNWILEVGYNGGKSVSPRTEGLSRTRPLVDSRKITCVRCASSLPFKKSSRKAQENLQIGYPQNIVTEVYRWRMR